MKNSHLLWAKIQLNLLLKSPAHLPAHLKTKYNRSKILTNISSRTRLSEVFVVAQEEKLQKSVVYQMKMMSLIQNAYKS